MDNQDENAVVEVTEVVEVTVTEEVTPEEVPAAEEVPNTDTADTTPQEEVEPVAQVEEIRTEEAPVQEETPAAEVVEVAPGKAGLEPVTEDEVVILKDEEKNEWRWWNDGQKLERLREAFLMGCDVLEACLYAEITKGQYTYYSSKVDPLFTEKVRMWREKPTLIARSVVVRQMANDPELSFKYLERRKKDEFGLRTEVTSNNGAPLAMVIDIVKDRQRTNSEEVE